MTASPTEVDVKPGPDNLLEYGFFDGVNDVIAFNNQLLVATQKGLYREDLRNSLRMLQSFPPVAASDDDRDARAVYALASLGDVIFAAAEGNVYRSKDNGKKWKR